jgi:two-component system sensor histidine kinase UhpB
LEQLENFMMTDKPTYEELEKEYLERKQIEEALQKDEETFRDLFNNAGDAIFIRKKEGRFLEVNQVACDRYGYSRKEFLQMGPKDLDTPGHSERIPERTKSILQKGHHIFETVHMTKDKKIIPVEISSRTIGFNGQNAIISIVRDITERKRTEGALRESEERFRGTFEQAAIGIAHVLPEGDFLRINKGFCDIVGYTTEEMLKLTFQDITHPDDLDIDLGYVRQMLSGEIQTYSMEKRYFKKNGSIVWINLTVSLIRKSSGEPKYFISAVENITKQKQTGQALQKAHDELKERTIDLEIKRKGLEELNTAMRVLLKKRENDKT